MRHTNRIPAWIMGTALLAAGMGLCPSAVAGGCDVEAAPAFTYPDQDKCDHFGIDMSISGDTAMIGANQSQPLPFGNCGPGFVQVYFRRGAAWTYQETLTADDGHIGDAFSRVSISGDTAVIGAPGDTCCTPPGSGTPHSGSAYVFVRTGTAWTQQAKLIAADAAAGGGQSFGGAVSISGDTIMVGARNDDEHATDAGAAYVFVRTGTAWTQQAKLTADDGTSFDRLGGSVSIQGDTAVAGATGGSPTTAFEPGAAYVFIREGAAWSQQAKFMATAPAAHDGFGCSVQIDGDTIVCGQRGFEDDGIDPGAAYVFVRSGDKWPLQATLTALDGVGGDGFGASVSISADRVLVGAPFSDGEGTDAGSAYLFTRTGAAWAQQAELISVEASVFDSFGMDTALDGDQAIVGAMNIPRVFVFPGGAYPFNLSCTAGDPADLSGDGLVNGIDLAMLLAAWGKCPRGGAPGSCPADLDGNGIVNGLDLAMLLAAWG